MGASVNVPVMLKTAWMFEELSTFITGVSPTTTAAIQSFAHTVCNEYRQLKDFQKLAVRVFERGNKWLTCFFLFIN